MPDPIFGLTEFSQNQSQAHLNANERFLVVDAFSVLRIESVANGPPGSPGEGDVHIVGAVPAGLWALFTTDNLAIYSNGGWLEIAARGGMAGELITGNGRWFVYSAEESTWVVTGEHWGNTEQRLRGRFPGDVDRFVQAFEFTGLANAGTAQVAHGITNPTLDEYNLLEGSFYDGTRSVALPWTDGTNVLQLRADGTNIEIVSNFDATTYNARVRWIYSKD